VLYNRAYRVMPGWIQSRLPYPLYSDDIKMTAFGHLWKMRDRLSRGQLHAVAELLPKYQNPRVRMSCLFFLSSYRIDPGLPILCRKLLNDPSPAIRLEAAIHIGSRPLRETRRNRDWPPFYCQLSKQRPSEINGSTSTGTAFNNILQVDPRAMRYRHRESLATFRMKTKCSEIGSRRL
jgi:hypothetical protein